MWEFQWMGINAFLGFIHATGVWKFLENFTGEFKRLGSQTITQSQSSVSLVYISMNIKLFIEKWNIETKNEKEFFYIYYFSVNIL